MTDVLNAAYEKFSTIVEHDGLFDDIEHFILLFSCGKDCSMLLDLFLRYQRDHQMQQPLSVFSVPYPKHMYLKADGRETENLKEIKAYWDNQGVSIQYVPSAMEDFADEDKLGCRVCKKARKSVIDPYIDGFPAKIGILTGFTLYDALSYLNMLLLTCNYELSSLCDLEEPTKTTTTKMLHKMSLREHLPNDKYMIRPILPFDEVEVAKYLEAKKIPHLTAPCKISQYKFKRLYSSALKVFSPFPATYGGIEAFLSKQGIKLNHNGLSFDDVIDDHFFIDC